jgi:predicted permease
MMRNLLTLTTQDPGVDTSALLRLGLDLPLAAYGSPEQRLRFYQLLDDRLAAQPGIRAALASAIPLGGAAEGRLLFEGRPEPPVRERPVVSVVTAGPRYFDTIGVRMLSGRGLGVDDGRPGRVSAVVNRRFAESYFDGQAVGQRVRLASDGEWMTIVGVVENVRQRPTESGDFDLVLYIPLAQAAPTRANILVRSRAADVLRAAAIVRTEVAAVDSGLPLFDVRTVDEQLAFLRWPYRVFGSMFAIFAGIAVLLAAIGLYALTAYSVAQRTQEIGVRIALGARAGQIVALVMRHAAVQLGIGVMLGGVGSIALGRVLPVFLAGRAGGDRTTLIAVATLLLSVAAVACVVPARRAARVDPLVALRCE